MSPEEAKAAGGEQPPVHNPGETLHQSDTTLGNSSSEAQASLQSQYHAIAGLVIVSAVVYFTLYATKKSEANAKDVAKAPNGTARPEETRPRK